MEAMGLSHVGEIGTVCEDHDEHMFFKKFNNMIANSMMI